jgi:LCP family protein required for cell wall assembly
LKRILLLAAIGALLYVLHAGWAFWSAARKVYEPPEEPRSEKRTDIVSVGRDPTMVLLLGVDKRKGDVGRADSIAVAALNPEKKTAVLLNIPRDLLVRIPGRTRHDKINHSYAYGGTNLTRRTVEDLLDLPVDGVVRIDMDGLSRMVDALGGIEVEVPFDFTYEGVRFRRGKMFLTGKETLAFVRMRKEDPHGDYGRIKRQQSVIRSIIRQGTDWSSITRLDDLLDAAGDHLKTDIPPLSWFYLQRNFSGMNPEDIHTSSVRGKTVKIGGVYYLIASDAEIRRVRTLLAKQIGWKQEEDRQTGKNPESGGNGL